MGLMPSYLGGIKSLGVKVICAFPNNQGTEYDSHQGVVLLFDAEHGLLRAIVDGTAVTAIRTAAVSGVATKAAGARGCGRPCHHRRRDAGEHAPGRDVGRAPHPPGEGLQRSGGGRTAVR